MSQTLSKSTTSHKSNYLSTIDHEIEKHKIISCFASNTNYFKHIQSAPNHLNSSHYQFIFNESKIFKTENFSGIKTKINDTIVKLRTLTILTETSEEFNNNLNPNILLITPKTKIDNSQFILKRGENSIFYTNNSLKTSTAGKTSTINLNKTRSRLGQYDISLMSDRSACSKSTLRKAEEFLDCIRLKDEGESPKEMEINNTLGCYLVTDQTVEQNFQILNNNDFNAISDYNNENYNLINNCNLVKFKWKFESVINKTECFSIIPKSEFPIKTSSSYFKKKNINNCMNFFGFLKYIVVNLIFLIFLIFLFKLKTKFFIQILCEEFKNEYLNKQNITHLFFPDRYSYNINNQIQAVKRFQYEIIFHKRLQELEFIDSYFP